MSLGSFVSSTYLFCSIDHPHQNSLYLLPTAPDSLQPEPIQLKQQNAMNKRRSYLWNARFLLQNDLCIACNPGAELGWKAECLVKWVCMEGLRPTEHSCHRFNCCADYIVVWILYSMTCMMTINTSNNNSALLCFV